MKLWQDISGGKNVKLLYTLKNIFKYLIPDICYRIRLGKIFHQFRQAADKDYILSRVDYYNKLFIPESLPESSPSLSQHKLGKSKLNYFFDSYEYTRWFPKSLRWNYLFGDVINVPNIPSIVKSRPINGDNYNSVILNLDKVRHFVFLDDYIPFEKKLNKIIFRGDIAHKPHRIRFMEMYINHPMCDLGEVNSQHNPQGEWHKKKISLLDHLDYKFILALEGNDVASNLKWVMSSNSIAVMPRPNYETWFMEGTLKPNFHYIEIKPDYSDLEERLDYYISHPEEAREIIGNAHDYVAQFQDKKRERMISLLVLRKYFQMTKQQM